MLNMRTQDDLNQVVALDKPESVIRMFWTEAQLHDRFSTFLNGTDDVDVEGVKLNPSLEEQYAGLYPKTVIVTEQDRLGNDVLVEEEVTYITYDETVEEPVLDADGTPVINAETNEPEVQEVPVISDEYYELDENGEVKLDEAGAKVLKEEYVDAPVVPSEELFKQTKISEWMYVPANSEVDMAGYVSFIKPILLNKVSTQFEKTMNMITTSYPEHEQKTWDKQEIEARAYVADNTAVTPMLDNIATVRGIDKDLLASKIIEKAEAFSNVVSMAIGYRQKAEDIIGAADTVEAIEVVIAELDKNREVFNQLLA